MPIRPPRAHPQGQPARPAPRATARERGYSAAWEKARTGFLAKHPRCECPIHKGTPSAPRATVVHHKTPHKGDKALFWNSANWQAMSKPCHDSHTGTHDRPESRRRIGARPLDASAPVQVR